MTSYTILEGEDFEGGHILSVVTTKEVAVQFVELYIKKYRSDSHSRPFKKDGEEWVSGCNKIYIEEHPVHEKLEECVFVLRGGFENK